MKTKYEKILGERECNMKHKIIKVLVVLSTHSAWTNSNIPPGKATF